MNDTSASLGFEFIKTDGGIDEYRLKSNGLTVLLMEENTAPVVTFMITYHVGSRNEASGYTGATHILEHMMFKGTQNYNRQKGTRIAEVLQNLGAQINATTWMDRTNYYELLPSEFLEEGIKVEADRMRNAHLLDEDRQAEMTVVRNEFERGENDPFTALDKQIWATAFQAHPYHHPTIGWQADIENVSTARLKEFYNTYYWPNNATATVIGDFETKQALRLLEKHFGQYSRSPHEIPEMYTIEPPQEGCRRLEIKRAGQTGIIGIAHKSVSGRHDDVFALQLLSNILGGGKASRLYRKLVESGLATNLFMWDFPLRDAGLFISYVFLTPGTRHETVQGIVLDEYADIRLNGVSDDEMKRAQAQLRSAVAFSRDGSYAIAASLNETIAIGDWTLYTNQLTKYAEITTADVQHAAEIYLVDNQSTIGWFIPEKNAKSAPVQTGNPHKPQSWSQDEARAKPFSINHSSDNSESQGIKLATRVEHGEILKGLDVFSINNGARDIITITGSLLGGDVYSPVKNPLLSAMVAEMLDQGTQKRSKEEINELLESVGAQISFSGGNYRIRFFARCLREDLSMISDLLAEQLRTPVFTETTLNTVKKRIIGELEQNKEDTRRQAQIAFLREMYPARHPNYHLTIEEEITYVEQINAPELEHFHALAYGLGSLKLVAAGAVNHAELDENIGGAFTGWQTVKLEAPSGGLSAQENQSREIHRAIPDKTSADMFIGQAIGIDRTHVDFYPLMLAMFILGGNFSARLMSTVRDQLGLTYGISSGLGGVDNGNDGYWFSWGTFAPKALTAGKKAIIDQLKKLVETGVSAQELNNKKTTLTGTFKVGLSTTAGLASQILRNAERDRTIEYLDQYPEIIRGIKLEEVNGMVKKYIELEKLTYASAGTLED